MIFSENDVAALFASDPGSAETQSRVARLALAEMTSDVAMATAVYIEINTDPHGTYVALTTLVEALTKGLTEAWTAGTDPQIAIEFVRAQLAALQMEEQHG